MNIVSRALRPVRTAEEQFKIAGFDTAIAQVTPHSYYEVGGKGGEALMTATEWEKYRGLCHEETSRHVGMALVKTRELEQTVNGALLTFCEEDREDALKVSQSRLAQVRELLLSACEGLKCGVMDLVRPSKGKGGEAA